MLRYWSPPSCLLVNEDECLFPLDPISKGIKSKCYEFPIMISGLVPVRKSDSMLKRLAGKLCLPGRWALMILNMSDKCYHILKQNIG